MRDCSHRSIGSGPWRLALVVGVLPVVGVLLCLGSCDTSSGPPEEEQPHLFGAIWAESPDYVVAVHSDGVIVFDGDERSVYPFDELPLRLWGTSRSELYASGIGVEHRFDGSAWTTRETAFGDEHCFMIDTPELALPYGRCGADKIVRREGGEFVVDHVVDENVFLAGFHGSHADNVYFVGTRAFYDDDGNTTGWEPVILRNQGAGWETVTTPFDIRVQWPFPDDVDYGDYLTNPTSVFVLSGGEVFIGKSFFGIGVYFDGTDWHPRTTTMKAMVGIPDAEIYGANPGCFMYGCSHSVSIVEESDAWQSLVIFNNHLVRGLFALPEGLLVNLCLSEADGWFSEKCGRGTIHYMGRDGSFAMLD